MRPATPASSSAAPPLPGDEEWEALGARGFVVHDGFVGEAVARAARAEADALHALGALRPAGLSRGAAHRVDRVARGDETLWLDATAASTDVGEAAAPVALGPALQRLVTRFDELREALRRGARVALARPELQLARYGAGARYERHRDALPGAHNRRVTAIVYLNDLWRPDDGGLLRLHPPAAGDATPPPVDVAPLLDRLVLFLAEQVEHEVLPARAPRFAVTAWYRGP